MTTKNVYWQTFFGEWYIAEVWEFYKLCMNVSENLASIAAK